MTQQSYKNLEIIIILEKDSDVENLRVIKEFHDERICVFHNENKLGISGSLNRGIELANGKYIARIDDDDICMPKRIEEQVKRMEKNPNMGLCGSNGYIIDENEVVKGITKLPTSCYAMKMSLYICNVVLSSSTMIRTEALIREKLIFNGHVSEDYLLWTQIARRYDVENIKEPLIAYRVHAQNRSNHLLQEQIKADISIQKDMWNEAKIDYSLDNGFVYCKTDDNEEIEIKESMILELYKKRFFDEASNYDFFSTIMLFYKYVYKMYNRYWMRFGHLYGKKLLIYREIYRIVFSIDKLFFLMYNKRVVGRKLHF